LPVHFTDALRSDQSCKQQRMRTVHPPVIDDIRFRPPGSHEPDETREHRIGHRTQHRPRKEWNRRGRKASLEQRGSIPRRKDYDTVAPFDKLARQGPETNESYGIGWRIRFIPITKEEPPHTSAR